MLTFDTVTMQQGSFVLTADLMIAAGSVTAVIGPSGGGKSTLLSAVAGFLEPAKGQVTWDGTVLNGHPPGKRPVAMLFQDNNLFPHLTARQNVALGVRPDLRLQAADETAVAAALDQVGLSGLSDRKPAALSGGQQSRVALARVLVANRPLVLLDEPFSALGPALKRDMLGLVREVLVAAGKTVVMVTHDPDDALAVADQVVLVADGAAHAPVSTQQIFDAPPPALRDYLGIDT
ncbi:thiamine ABC transporter ATP-binding protein [Yoonia sp. 208BN28-4]|uniref:thiamine ABC transporter ATP-binding protein n=1 Tax=Yoonia sp. 208BN28-4 TaxID=3126505 RepID=UPI0030AED191